MSHTARIATARIASLALRFARIAPADRVVGSDLAIASFDNQFAAAGGEEILPSRHHRFTCVGKLPADPPPVTMTWSSLWALASC